ncbi:hypothetical protein EBS80_03785 [bacterium]|nr:hypothetical protein [bacterium]
MFPASRLPDLGFLAFAGIAAMGSKFLITRQNRHLLNPAAIGALVAGLLGYSAAWWVATPVLLPFLLVAAYLVVRKTRRERLFALYVLVVMAARIGFAYGQGTVDVLGIAWETLASWPAIFLGAFMLTEPLTLPAERQWQSIEAATVGLLSVIPFQIGALASSPELALIVGNVLSACVSPKRLMRLTLVKKTETAPGLWDFAFASDVTPRFEPGQYLEWTLPHAKPDSRGNRRTFTVASSPTEPHVHLGVRIPSEKPSSFKRALSELKPGDRVFGSNLLGEFTMPKRNVPMAWIAGGIGVTPFRAMAQHIVDRGEQRDVVLYYACRTEADFAYRDVFEGAAPLGLRLVCLTDFLTADRIKNDTPDYASRLWYLSGPPMMVDSYKKLLRSIGVSKKMIRTDYFPGY